MHRLGVDESVRKLWLRESQFEEKSKSIFVMPYRMIAKRDLLLIWRSAGYCLIW